MTVEPERMTADAGTVRRRGAAMEDGDGGVAERATSARRSPGAAAGTIRGVAWRASALLAIATAATAASGWRLAEPLAVALAIAVVIAIAAGIGRDRGDTTGRAPVEGDAARAASLRAALRIGAIVVLASGTIVALSLEWRLAAAGMAMTVAILSIVGAPAWLAIVSDERERVARGTDATEPTARPGRGRTAQAPPGG